MKVKFKIPGYVKKVARMLNKEGYSCYLVGGALRDVVLGIEPDDYDLATNAKPDAMLNIFPKSVSTGERFGMISALVPDEMGEIHDVQVTTFRSEGDYVDGRWPTNIEFVEDLDKDLGRRDFTFNSMALDLSLVDQENGNIEEELEIYDPFGGLTDLAIRVVRAVGTPIERFKEDGLRAFKACRMASQLQFDIEKETFDAISQSIPVAKMVSMERVRDEFMKMLNHSHKPSIGIELMRKTGLLAIFMPELLEGLGVEQKVWHADDVFYHSIKCVDFAQDRIKLAALFHDIGKPRCDMGNGHFYGHDIEGEKMTREIMTRMRFSKSETNRIANLVRNHMFYYPYEQEDMTEEQKQHLREKEWSDGAVRRFIQRVGEENIDDLFALRIADATSNPKTGFKPDEIQLLQQRISKVKQEDMALKISDLDINGHDLMEMGVEGRRIGEILDILLEKVVDDPLVNSKDKLIEIVKTL